jgi:16S rRNA (cytidine1402-2'-O)-methyltransferase
MMTGATASAASPVARRFGTLYLVPNTLDFGSPAGQATPALDDVLPLGVIRLAARLGFWVCENAKTTRAFLKRVDAISPLAAPLQSLSLHELPRLQKSGGSGGASKVEAAREVWLQLLAPALDGRDMGLQSEAGLPAVADPGAGLVQAAHGLGIRVEALPGASSLLLALAASGLQGQSFSFVGYLPVDAAARNARIRELEALSRRLGQTQLMIETPYRNPALLGALLGALQPTTRLAVACGLTMPGGFNHSDTVAGWRQQRLKAPAALPTDVPVVFSLLAAG